MNRAEREYTQPTWPQPWGYARQGPEIVYPAAPSPDTQQATAYFARVVQDASKETVFVSQNAPHQAPPYRARQISAAVRIVVAPVTGDAAATAASVSLAAAEGAISGTALTILTPTAVSAFVTVLSYPIPLGYRARITGGGVWASNTAHDAITWAIKSGGEIITDQTQWALSDSKDYLDTYDIPFGNKLVEIVVQNRDTHSPVLIEARINGWLFPTLQQDDTVRSLILNNGVETNGRFSSTQFCPAPAPPNMAPPQGPCPPGGPPGICGR